MFEFEFGAQVKIKCSGVSRSPQPIPDPLCNLHRARCSGLVGHQRYMPGVEAVSAAAAKSGHWAHPYRYRIHGGPQDGQCFESLAEDHLMLRVGKKAAGRVLDGRTWDQMPGVADG